MLDLLIFPDNVGNEVNDNWREFGSMELDFSVEEILDMIIESEA